MTVYSPQQLERMTAAASDIGALMADWPDRFVWYWIAKARDELIDECSPTASKTFIEEVDTIDRMLDVMENRRAEIRSTKH